MIVGPRTIAWLALAAIAAFLISLRWWVQLLLRMVLSIRYRLIVLGKQNVPRTGPVLIAANHVSWLDGFFLAAACPRRGKALVSADYVDWPVVRHWAHWIGLVAVPVSGPKAHRAMFETCRKILDEGGVLGIFPEAQLSRNGLPGPFLRGLEVIVAGRDQVAVVPAFLDNLWCSVFSFSGGRFFRKWPRGLRRTVIIAFGPVVPKPVSIFSVRQAVLEAGVTACSHRRRPRPLETIDPALPHLDHHELGALCGSTANYDRDGIRQIGQKPGTVGHPLPGVALRVLGASDEVQPAETLGRLQALIPG
ncbi:MAG: 1-acyl-sn-glycerol-3-phosphate acyltransferase, partial [Planctomycetaceae bacterium]|nr:1-acyl-sn-glycerol-3-phosphate acyltransferase [Planctomycetaceae bacterium]